jgi:hypothetical protein
VITNSSRKNTSSIKIIANIDSVAPLLRVSGKSKLISLAHPSSFAQEKR